MTKCLLKNAASWWVLSHFLRIASECNTSQKLSLWSFHRNYCTIKNGAQTYDFIADKSYLLFSIILKVLSGLEGIRTQGKCIKSYMNFSKDFVVEQNFTRLRGDIWSYVNRPYWIIVVWDDRTTGKMDPWDVMLYTFSFMFY